MLISVTNYMQYETVGFTSKVINDKLTLYGFSRFILTLKLIFVLFYIVFEKQFILFNCFCDM